MEIAKIYQNEGALLSGHFLLSSGNHSDHYLQSAKILEKPWVCEELCNELAKQMQELQIDAVVSPAIGGLLAGYELARALKVRFLFTERVNGEMTMRRGFEIKPNEKVLICEDVITTGGSAMEAAKIVEAQGGEIVGFAALANRGFCERVGGNVKRKLSAKLPSDKPLFALADFDFATYTPDECPLCKTGSKAIKPGSRGN
jgi:orotate phosphoribosyltransferase